MRGRNVLFLFDNFALDRERRELCADGAPVSIEPQVFDLLVYLIENRGRVVSKDDLIASVWGGRIVSEFYGGQPNQRGAQGYRRQRQGAALDPYVRAEGLSICGQRPGETPTRGRRNRQRYQQQDC